MGSSKILLYNMGIIIIIAPPELCFFQNILLIRIGLTISVAWKKDGDHISCLCIILVSLFNFLELQNYWICCYIILMIHLRSRAKPKNVFFNFLNAIIKSIDAFHFLCTLRTLISMSTPFKLHISSCYQDQVWGWSCLIYITSPILFLDYTRFSLIKVNFDTRVKGFDLNKTFEKNN